MGEKQGSFLKKMLTDFEEEDEEAERIFGTLYKTGDFARIVNDRLYYEGRIDSQVPSCQCDCTVIVHCTVTVLCLYSDYKCHECLGEGTRSPS